MAVLAALYGAGCKQTGRLPATAASNAPAAATTTIGSCRQADKQASAAVQQSMVLFAEHFPQLAPHHELQTALMLWSCHRHKHCTDMACLTVEHRRLRSILAERQSSSMQQRLLQECKNLGRVWAEIAVPGPGRSCCSCRCLP
jgi:hypothetical protein